MTAKRTHKKSHQKSLHPPAAPAELYDLLAAKCDVSIVDNQLAVDYSAPDTPVRRRLADVFNKVAVGGQDNVKPGTADIITIGDRLHCQRLQEFYAEADRMLKPGGVIAAWCHSLPRINETLDKIADEIFDTDLAATLTPEERMERDAYKTMPFPYLEVNRIGLESGQELSFGGYLKRLYDTPALKRHIAITGTDPVVARVGEMKDAWGAEKRRWAKWDINLLMGRKPEERTRMDSARRAEIRRQQKQRRQKKLRG